MFVWLTLLLRESFLPDLFLLSQKSYRYRDPGESRFPTTLAFRFPEDVSIFESPLLLFSFRHRAVA